MLGRTSARRAVAAGALGFALVATGAMASAVPDDRGRYTQGSAGIGDPYFPAAGNGGIDVLHYELKLHYTPPAAAPAPLEGTLAAKATIALVATQDLERFNLDLRGLTANSVTVDGKSARFTQDGQELVITPRPKLKRGERATVVVAYGGTTGQPRDIEGALYGWVTMRDGAMVANEPEGSSTWFPVNDHPRDKATYEFDITVPEGKVAVANGKLVRQRTAAGWTTWSWDAPDQMAAYLATASVGDYELSKYRAPNGLPIIDAVDKDVSAQNRAGLAQQGEMVVYFESLFGRYPFVAFGAIVDDDSIGYALETQTRPIYSRRAVESTVAHELTHQWYGNAVSPRRWQDIWLNEGWATYGEWLWIEHDGDKAVQEQFDEVLAIAADDPFWQVVVADPGPTGLFVDAVYDRGAATLHALREKIGDSDFFRLARAWVRIHNDSTATTEDFEALAERISGRNLDQFFDVWVHTGSKPTTW